MLDAQGINAILGPWAVAFGLILIRVGALILTAPIFTITALPNTVKAGLVGALTLLIILTIGPAPALADADFILMALAALREALVGGVLGLSVMILFGALSFAGQLIGIQMGFAMANVMDPTSGSQVGVLAQSLRFFGFMLFFTLDGHLLLIQALLDSYQLVPLGGGLRYGMAVAGGLIGLGGQLFELGLRIAMPIISVVLLVNTGLALIARTVPQVNVFVMGFIFTISLGIFIFGLSLPATAVVFEGLMTEALRTGVQLIRMF